VSAALRNGEGGDGGDEKEVGGGGRNPCQPRCVVDGVVPSPSPRSSLALEVEPARTSLA
jgi:hypothetical protein